MADHVDDGRIWSGFENARHASLPQSSNSFVRHNAARTVEHAGEGAAASDGLVVATAATAEHVRCRGGHCAVNSTSRCGLGGSSDRGCSCAHGRRRRDVRVGGREGRGRERLRVGGGQLCGRLSGAGRGNERGSGEGHRGRGRSTRSAGGVVRQNGLRLKGESGCRHGRGGRGSDGDGDRGRGSSGLCSGVRMGSGCGCGRGVVIVVVEWQFESADLKSFFDHVQRLNRKGRKSECARQTRTSIIHSL